MSELIIEKVGLSESNQFSKLFLDYIHEDERLASLYTYTPNIQSFDAAILNRSMVPVDRALLTACLKEQYKEITLSEKMHHQIDSLLQPNTYTITTGHQLCLGTGPLYLILKTLTCIKICEALKSKHPDKHFVPVFWMASEDHDSEEINHFYVFGKKYTWETNQTGAVGRFTTDGISELLETIKDIPAWLKEAYSSSATLAHANRKVIHHLFSEYGVVVIDGDDAALKHSFSEVVKRELAEKKSAEAMLQVNDWLKSNGYSVQVNPRDINLFYLKDQFRERIEKDGDIYKVVHSDLTFTYDQLIEELKQHPERFSPNVVLRPLYENVILPDLAYVGGPGEIAYWLQIKKVFEAHEVFYPVVFPRMFSGVLSAQQIQKLQKACIVLPELFLPEHQLKHCVVERADHEDVSIESSVAAVTMEFDSIIKTACKVDASLDTWAKAEKVKMLKQLEDIEKKIRKSEERKHEDLIKSVLGIKDKMLPNGSLQERQESVFTYSINDTAFIHSLYTLLNPFDFSIQIACYA